MNNPCYFAILSADVRYSNEISSFEKLLYAEITALCNMNGVCFATNDYFANLYKKSNSSITKSVSNLAKAGFISSKLVYKKDSKQVEKRVITLSEKITIPLVKNYEDNNTLTGSNNIKINKKEFSLLDSFRKSFKEEIKISDETLLDFIRYRKEIKKEIKTATPLIAFTKALAKCVKAGYSKDEVINLVKEREWQTLKLDWVKKVLTKNEDNTTWSNHGTDYDDSKEWK